MTSPITPKNSAMMYTSGWPEPEQVLPQDRVATGRIEDERGPEPPLEQQHDQAPVMAGTRTAPPSRIVHENTGIRSSDIPGARRVKIVSADSTAPKTDATPVSSRPTIQRSVPVVVEYGIDEFGA